MSRKNAVIAVALLAAPIVLACVAPALASSGGSLPWEGPLQQIQESITGRSRELLHLQRSQLLAACSSLGEN